MAADEPALIAATSPAAAPLERLPDWVRLIRAANPGPMTLDGTNTWVLRASGGSAAVLVDPGPLEESHLSALARQAPIGAILVTHGHPDHVDGLDRLLELLPTAPAVSRGGQAGAARWCGMDVTTLRTPGHTADSVSYLVEHAGEAVVLTGDTILGRGSTVVAYPDGDLGDYLDSLAAMARLGPVAVLPGHGPALSDCAAAARHYLAHRHARLDQVRQALAAGARSAADVVAAVYAEVDPALHGAAELSARAQLAYLRRAADRPGLA